MQFNSSGRPRAPNDAQKLKKLFLVEISRKATNKGLKQLFPISKIATNKNKGLSSRISERKKTLHTR